jgi:hypothetical protein
VTGHAKKLDEYLSDARASFHDTYTNDKIKFRDPEDPDPDWKVKQDFTLIIAVASEIENGVDYLWKRGSSSGRRDYPDFGKYMSSQLSPSAGRTRKPGIWTNDKPWEVFLPCLAGFNERRPNLLKNVLLMLDESMSG